MDSVEKSLVGVAIAMFISAIGVLVMQNLRVGSPTPSVVMPNANQQSWTQPNVESNPQPYGPPNNNNCNGPNCPW